VKPLIEQRLRLARDGFMRQALSRVRDGIRPHFDNALAPVPKIAPSQWDCGDTTSRALIAWLRVRQMLGDPAVDPEVESGLWQYLQTFIHPETGLVYCPDHSDPKTSGYYYHLWDQGMFFQYLVLRLQHLSAEREQTLARIRRLQKGLFRIARHSVLHDRQGIPGLVPDFATAIWWETDCYWNDSPKLPARDFGKMHWTGFTLTGALALYAQARLLEITRDPQDRQLAQELAHGYLCGFEQSRGSRSPMFDDAGRFQGHFHSAVTGLVGLVTFARDLLAHGDAALGEKYIDLAIRAYRWIFDASTNPSPACSCGYFPETAMFGPRNGISGMNEVCGTADMLELAAALAGCHSLRLQWRALADLWDDIERFTVNDLFHTQFTKPERLPGDAATLNRLRGAWISSRSFPSDLGLYRTGGEPPQLPVAGCCGYSGIRALYTAWTEAVTTEGDVTEVRIVTEHEDANVVITPRATGGLRYRAKRDHQLRVRAPRAVAPDGWITRTPRAGEADEIAWDKPRWSTREKCGSFNIGGAWPALAENETPTYALTYEGNHLVRIDPSGLKYPFLEGL